MGRVDNKVAVITGGGTGIGKACAELFAREGAKVFLIGRTKSKVDDVASQLEAKGYEAGSAAADLSDFESSRAAFQAAIDKFGRVDILVNNAGVGYSWQEVSPGSMADTVTCEPEKWREVMRINLDSVFNMSKLAIPVMQKQGGGAIVNVASIWGMLGAEDAHAYTASKGAIINYTRSLCVTYAKDNIRTNALCPGFVDTNMIKAVMHWFDDPTTAAAVSPARRAGRPEEIAYAALFLGSDEGSFCNGTALVADGGTTAR
jgi:NAD(P)-dependent dehydrogenase (short-subunit alcohol dehydrogenase family)